MNKIILAALLLVISMTPLKSQEDHAEQRDVAKDTEGQKSGADLPPLWTVYSLTWAASEKNKIEPDWRNPNCQNPNNHDEADLCEQRKMSESAAETVYWGKLQVFLSAFGFAVLLYTIYLTYRATGAAIESNEIARETAQQELRAYLGFSDHSIVNGEEFRITVNNYGATPARQVSAHLNIFEVNAGEDISEDFPFQDFHNDGEKSIGFICGGQPAVFKFMIDSSQLERVKTGEAKIFIYGHVDYVDIYNEGQCAQFCYVGVSRGDGAGTIVVYDRHNDCT